MPIKGISDARDPIEDLPDYSKGDQLPGGRSWPPRDGPQPWSDLWRHLPRHYAASTAEGSALGRFPPIHAEQDGGVADRVTRIYSNEGGLTGLDPRDELDAT